MTYRSIADLDKWLFSHLKDNEEISDDIAAEYIARKAFLAKNTAEKEGALGYLEKYFASKAPRKSVNQNFLKNVIKNTISSSKRSNDIRSNDSYDKDYRKEKSYYERDYRDAKRRYDDYDRYNDYYDKSSYSSRDRYSRSYEYNDSRYKKRDSDYYEDHYRKRQKYSDSDYNAEKKENQTTYEKEKEPFESNNAKEGTNLDVLKNDGKETLEDQENKDSDKLNNVDSSNTSTKRIKIGRGSTKSRFLDVIFNIESENDEITLTKKELKKLKKKEKKRRKKEKKEKKRLKKLLESTSEDTQNNIENSESKCE